MLEYLIRECDALIKGGYSPAQAIIAMHRENTLSNNTIGKLFLHFYDR